MKTLIEKNMYYNTTNLTGFELAFAIQQAENQNERVLMIFENNPIGLTPSEAHTIYEGANFQTPLTSIRRAISDLTKLGKLEMTSEFRNGYYKRKNFVWKIKS